jgi:hypothetical protein
VPLIRFPHPPEFEDGIDFKRWRQEIDTKVQYDHFPSDEVRGAYVFTRLTRASCDAVMLAPKEVVYEWIEQRNGVYTHTELLDFLETQYGVNGTRLLRLIEQYVHQT